MNHSFVRFVSRLLVVCMIGLPFQVNAGMIGTDAVLSSAQVQAARDAVQSFVSRADVASQLHSRGLSPQAAAERVNALTDAEVAGLAGRIEDLPAGASVSGIIFIGLLVWLLWYVVKK